MTGVIGHVPNPDLATAVGLARAAEESGARWVGLADAFWWRDVWMMLGAVAAATERIEVGPAMTNPYLRHPFHTAAALATLQGLAGTRVFCGIAAGGSELTVAAGIDRGDAPQRCAALVRLLRAVAAGEPLDPPSGRTLDMELAPVPVLMAGRGDAMLDAAGAWADRVLLWSVPQSDLERSAAVVWAGAASRDNGPELIWAPLVRLPVVPEASLRHVAVYAAINSAAPVRAGWGLDAALVRSIRRALVAGGTTAAVDLVPAAALDDLVLEDASPVAVAARARALGVTGLAVPGFSVEGLPDQLAWAAAVEQELRP